MVGKVSHGSCATFALCLTISGAAHADNKQTAKELFERGLSAMEAKNYTSACPDIEQSLALDPYPGTLFTLAECEALAGHNVAALKRYNEYLALYASLPKAKQLKQGSREKDAKNKVTELSKLVGEVTLNLPPSAPADANVTLDGKRVEPSQLGSAIMLDAGPHTVTTQVPGLPSRDEAFTLEKGEKKSVALTFPSPAPPEKSSSVVTTPPPRSVQLPLAIAAGGVGVAGIAVGAVTGALMLVAADVVKNNCTDGADGVAYCNSEGADAGNNAKTYGLVATIGFATGAAFLATGVVLFITRPRAGDSKSGLHLTLPVAGILPTTPFGGNHPSVGVYPPSSVRMVFAPAAAGGAVVQLQGSF